MTALRCGLDSSSWRQRRESREVCKKLLSTEASEAAQPPFDAQLAHALYRDLFGGIEDLIRDKSLLHPFADAGPDFGAGLEGIEVDAFVF